MEGLTAFEVTDSSGVMPSLLVEPSPWKVRPFW